MRGDPAASPESLDPVGSGAHRTGKARQTHGPNRDIGSLKIRALLIHYKSVNLSLMMVFDLLVHFDFS